MAMADLLLALLGGAALPRADLLAGITRLTGQTRSEQVERCLHTLRAGGFVAVHGSPGRSRPLVLTETELPEAVGRQQLAPGRSRLFTLTETGRARAHGWLTAPGGCRALAPRDLAARALLGAWPQGEPGALWRRTEISRRRRLLAARAGQGSRSDVAAQLRLARLRRTLEVELVVLAELAGDSAEAAFSPPRREVRGSR